MHCGSLQYMVLGCVRLCAWHMDWYLKPMHIFLIMKRVDICYRSEIRQAILHIIRVYILEGGKGEYFCHHQWSDVFLGCGTIQCIVAATVYGRWLPWYQIFTLEILNLLSGCYFIFMVNKASHKYRKIEISKINTESILKHLEFKYCIHLESQLCSHILSYFHR